MLKHLDGRISQARAGNSATRGHEREEGDNGYEAPGISGCELRSHNATLLDLFGV